MSFSQSAAINIVPLLARLVLAVAFIPAGYNKLMQETDFSGEEAKRLRELQVIATATTQTQTQNQTSLVMPVSLVQSASDPVKPAGDKPADAKPSTDESGAKAAKPAAANQTTGGVSGAATGEPIRARSLHKITLMIDRAGISSYQTALAWMAAITELVGGIFLVLGLFSRLWAFGLAIAMGVAFWLTSLPVLKTTSIFALSIPDYNRFVVQIALLALALGILLTGAGGLSLDRRMAGTSAAGSTKKPTDD